MEFRRVRREEAEEILQLYRSLIGTAQTVIPEECGADSGEGWSGTYVRTRIQRPDLVPGRLVRTRITGMDDNGVLLGE